MISSDALSDTVLVLFCKQPRPGYGKQRLAADIGKTAACRIAEGLLSCALEDAVAWRGKFTIAVSSRAELPWALSLAAHERFRHHDIRVAAQNEGNLGERLNEIDQRVRATGATKLVFMAADAPSLGGEHFDAVVTGLDAADVVLADDCDGGVTLMASRTPWPALRDLPWSSEQLGDALATTCAANGLSVRRLPGGFDIDTGEDLDALVTYLRDDQRPARQSLAAIVRDVLKATA